MMQITRRRVVRRGLVPLGTAVAFALALAAGTGASFGATSPSGTSAGVRSLTFRGQHSQHGGKGGSVKNLVDNGGPILPSSHTYAIWWGDPTAWPTDVEAGMAEFFGNLTGTPFLSTANQYMRGPAAATASEPAAIDTSAPPRKVSASTLGTEIAKVYGTSIDPSGVYFVFTSNFPKGGNFCAWHSDAAVNGTTVAVAYMPNVTGVAGCDPGNPDNLSGSEGLRALANVTSHEFMEAITDAQPAAGSYAWIDASGQEIGDKCAWTFGSPVTLADGSQWRLQEEWSNAVSGCVQETALP